MPAILNTPPLQSQPSMTRLQRCFADGKTKLVPYIMAGYPDRETTFELLRQLPDAGADIIELGMPFSDPVADGPVIDAAARASLANGTKLKHVLRSVEKFRKSNRTTPIILMGYINPVYRYGAEAFMHDAGKAGVDGLLLVDLPMEEEAEFAEPAKRYGIDLIHLVSPVTPPARLDQIAAHSQGFLYYVALTGTTGSGSANNDSMVDAVASIRQISDLPVGVGFGIRQAEQVAALKGKVSAVIVGSELIRRMDQALADGKKPLNAVKAAVEFVKELAKAK